MAKQLSTHQAALLERTAKADDDYKSAKRTLEAEIRLAAEKGLRNLEDARNRLVKECLEAEISKRMIGRVALHTAHPRAVDEIIERAPDIGRAAIPETRRSAFSWIEHGRSIAVYYRSFPTTYRGEGYPDVLEGIVELDDSRVGMHVVEDKSDQTVNGLLRPGYIHYELGKSQGKPDELRGLIADWAEANA
ncbi:hypothetical protein CMP1-60 [Clavibacter phage CMP1]|uniref:Uncharacterized protein n=1 Tax=Clavibacter phage CMP1 TaxID=686439 RepID=D0U244_9CAUD|nr:hypothetical protein CMP1-60 [Clavibacter phage CMP1]ACY35953.1 hypothetical protein CMP1-60 [Clavibacter phage CMP1]